MAFTQYTLLSTRLLLLFLLLLFGSIAAQNICVNLTKIKLPKHLNCNFYTDTEYYGGYLQKNCSLYSEIYISSKHSNDSIKGRYKETLHIHKVKQIFIRKFWTFDQKLPDVVQFNLSISYTMGKKQDLVPLDYYLVPFHTDMNQFPQGQQFSTQGNSQDQQLRIEIWFLNNCTFQDAANLHMERNKKSSRNDFLVLVNGSVSNETEIYFYKTYDTEVRQELNLTTESNLNDTVKPSAWHLTLGRFWELWFCLTIMTLTVIFSITSAIYWCWKGLQERKIEKQNNEALQLPKNLDDDLRVLSGLPVKIQLRRLSIKLLRYSNTFSKEESVNSHL